jgi:hypothetical protein
LNIHPATWPIIGAGRAFYFCIEGGMVTELDDGRKMELTKGMTYQVGDNMEATALSVEVDVNFIVD